MDIPIPSMNCLLHHTMITLIPIKGIITERSDKICGISATSFQCIVNNANNYYGKVEQFILSI
jgi:hypothetical protein